MDTRSKIKAALPEAMKAKDELRTALRSIAIAYRPHSTLLAALYDVATYDRTTRDELDAMEATRIQRWSKHISRGQRRGHSRSLRYAPSQ